MLEVNKKLEPLVKEAEGFRDEREYEAEVDIYNETLALKKAPELYYKKGIALYSLAKYEEAVECFDEAIRIDENFTDAINAKGRTLRELGRTEEAIKEFN